MRVWLRRLQLPEYTEMFEREGYSTGEDLESLKDLKESDLTAMGISKRGKILCKLIMIITQNKQTVT